MISTDLFSANFPTHWRPTNQARACLSMQVHNVSNTQPINNRQTQFEALSDPKKPLHAVETTLSDALKDLPIDGDGTYCHNGEHYIQMDGHLYQVVPVRHQHNLMQLVNPANPASRFGFFSRSEDGRWQQIGLKGGAPVQSLPKPGLFAGSPNKQILMDLLLLGCNIDDVFVANADILAFMPESVAENIIKNLTEDLKISDRADLLKNMTSLSTSDFKFFYNKKIKLYNKLYAWDTTDVMTSEIKKKIKNFTLNDEYKIKIFYFIDSCPQAWPRAGNMITACLTDKFTGAQFFVISRKDHRQKITQLIENNNSLHIDASLKAWNLYANMKKNEDNQLTTSHVTNIMDTDEIYRQLYLQETKKLMLKKQISGMLTEIRKTGLPYLVLNKGKSDQHTFMMITSDDVDTFSQSLHKYNESLPLLLLETQTKASSHVKRKKNENLAQERSKTTEEEAGLSTSGVNRASSCSHEVTISDLAQIQMSYDNFPRGAGAKINEVIDDIQAGRVTTKRILGHYYYDIPQLGSGGRGKWRAAFERKQNTWILKGFIDYHHSKNEIWAG